MPGTIPFLAVILSFMAAVVPTAGWTWLVWWCDRYEREPRGMVLAAFVWGAFPAVLLAVLVETLLGVPGGAESSLRGQLVAASAVAPVVEELIKGLALLFIARVWRREFDDVLDGILYGALIGFGFAMTENFFYYLSAIQDGGWGQWVLVVFLRGVIFGLNHAFFTALTGAALGYAVSARGRFGRRWVPWIGLAAAILAHVLHNLGASLTEVSVAAILVSLFSDMTGVLFVVGMLLLALRQERRWLREELGGEVGRLVTQTEYEQLLHMRGRAAMLRAAQRVGGWRAVSATRRFQEAATELAFRKRRWRMHTLPELAVEQQRVAEAKLTAARAALPQNPLLNS